jgi:hypothetical protein
VKKEIKNRKDSWCKFSRGGRTQIKFCFSQDSHCKLDLDLTSELCQTVGDELFLLLRATPIVWQTNLASI